MKTFLDRRLLLAGGLAAFIAGPAIAADAEQVVLPVQGRQVTLSVFRPAATKGVILFSHGAGGAPENYLPLIGAWTDAGWLVVAPLHTDSQKLLGPGQQQDLRGALMTRIADLAAASAWAAKAAPGKPAVAAGHSYGSAIAMIRGGAADARIHAADPTVKAVIAFSTPGDLGGLLSADAFATLTVPTLVFTGDDDVVPGFTTDWHAHLRPFESGPAAGRLAWVGQGVDHKLAARTLSDPMLADAAALSVTFLAAIGLDDAAASARLAGAASKPRIEIQRRS